MGVGVSEMFSFLSRKTETRVREDHFMEAKEREESDSASSTDITTSTLYWSRSF